MSSLRLSTRNPRCWMQWVGDSMDLAKFIEKPSLLKSSITKLSWKRAYADLHV